MKKEIDNDDCLVKSEVVAKDSQNDIVDDDSEMAVSDESTPYTEQKFNDTKTPPIQLKSKRGMNPLSHYARTIILKDLKENGVNKVESEGIKGKFKCEPNEVEDYVNYHAERSQLNVHFECDSPSFQSVNKWLEKFKDKNLHKFAANEPALLLKLFGNLDNHPDPHEAGGVNFEHLYDFLGNVMSGLPAIELDQPTQSFLCDVFGELINDVNSGTGDENLIKLQHTLHYQTNNPNLKNRNTDSISCKESTFLLGLDPLHVSGIPDENIL